MPDKRKPPKWRAPLTEWVREIVFAWRLRGLYEPAAELVAISRHLKILRMLGQLLGKGGPPVTTTDVFRPPFPYFPRAIMGPMWRSMVVAEIQSRALIANLSTQELLRLGAAAELMAVAAFAANQDTRLERGGPLNLEDPGEVVGFLRHTDKLVSRRNKALAVGGRIVGAMFGFYSRAFPKIVITLVKSTVGITLTLKEVNALIDRHLATLRARPRSSPFAP
jgi:hypothetical protein